MPRRCAWWASWPFSSGLSQRPARHAPRSPPDGGPGAPAGHAHLWRHRCLGIHACSVCGRPWGGGLGGALVLVNILPLVFDLGEDAQFGTCTGLVAVPVQAAAVLGPNVAGFVVEATGSQRMLFGVAAVALGIAWLLLQRVRIGTVVR